MKAHELIRRLIENKPRTVFESMLVPDVEKACRDWMRGHCGGILIGGNALSLYTSPRVTMDVNLLFGSVQEIPETVPGFTKTSAYAFTHHETGVEIEVVTPEFLRWPPGLYDTIARHTTLHEALHVIDRAGLVASKLMWCSRQDLADIEKLMRGDPATASETVSAYGEFLSPAQLQCLRELS